MAKLSEGRDGALARTFVLARQLAHLLLDDLVDRDRQVAELVLILPSHLRHGGLDLIVGGLAQILSALAAAHASHNDQFAILECRDRVAP